MGAGTWNISDYQDRVQQARAAGRTSFDYTDRIRAGRTATAVHQLLDPKVTAGPSSPYAGQVMREVVISDEHPNPTAIAVVLDVTGSNYSAAVSAHAKMPQLLGLLQRKGYVEDPQINFCAIGDAYTDNVPLQMGQFESDNRIDEQLEAMYLEGLGGGQRSETYELAAYFLARHTALEPFTRDGRKGYVFFIGDELPYKQVRKQHVRDLIGVELEEDISTAAIFKELQEKYHVFFLFQMQGAYRASEILPAWQKLLGERALKLDDPDAVCETIALTLGLLEGTVDLDEGLDDLREVGADLRAIRAAGQALATVSGATGGRVARIDGSLPTDNAGGATRL